MEEQASARVSTAVILLLLWTLVVGTVSGQLSFGFYGASCPTAELIIKNTVRSASSNDASVPGKLLRLVFHDCFIEGCDASILVRGNGTEQTDPANQSVGGYSVIDAAKKVLEFFCPATVSCADIIALAARDAVELSGGPSVEIPTGRKDGRFSSISNVRSNIIDTSFTMDQMINIFASKGLSLTDLVTLSGAHTIGSAHCNSFSDRFRPSPSGHLTLIDSSSLDKSYADQLMTRCPVGASPTITVTVDPATSVSFDNQYYNNLVSHKGLFQSDSALFSDSRTKKLVEQFAQDQQMFFQNWGKSFLKLTSIGVKGDGEGEVRLACSKLHNK